MAAQIMALPTSFKMTVEPRVHAQLARRAEAACMSEEELARLVLSDFLAQPREWYWKEVGRQHSDRA